MASSFKFILVLLFLFTIHYSLITNFASAQSITCYLDTSGVGTCRAATTCPPGLSPAYTCNEAESLFPGTACNSFVIPCVAPAGITNINPPPNLRVGFTNYSAFFGFLISRFLLYATALTGAFFLYRTITAGFTYMTSVGDPGKVQAATKQLTNALTGLIVIVSAYFIIQIAELMFGITIL